MARTSSPLLGVHFWNPARTPGYPVPTLFVEHVYAQRNGDPGRHWLEMADRCRVLRDAGHRVLLKVKFRVGIDQPRTMEELDAYLHGLEALAPSFGGIDVTFGNEPNWRHSAADDPSVSPAWMARVFNGAGTEPGNPWNALHVWRTHAESRCRYFVTPTGPFAPRGADVATDGVEESPWAQWTAEFWRYCKGAARIPWSRRFDGVALHAYARTGPDGQAHGGGIYNLVTGAYSIAPGVTLRARGPGDAGNGRLVVWYMDSATVPTAQLTDIVYNGWRMLPGLSRGGRGNL